MNRPGTDASGAGPGVIARLTGLTFAVLAYLAAVRSLAYMVGFLNGWLVPRGIDDGPARGVGAALTLDLALLGSFALVHSLTARPGFAAGLARIVPSALTRSVYVFLAGVHLSLVFWLWATIATPVWRVEGEAARLLLTAIGVGGWLFALVALRELGHLRLFGLRPAWRWFRGRDPEPSPLVTRGLHGLVRHPLYVGFVVGCWSTPTMSGGRLLFAAGLTVYVAIGWWLEERDLSASRGEEITRYRARVPAFLPWPRPRDRRR